MVLFLHLWRKHAIRGKADPLIKKEGLRASVLISWLWNWRNPFGWKGTEVTGLAMRFSEVNKVFLSLPHSSSKVHKTPGWLSEGVLLWWQMKRWSHFTQNATNQRYSIKNLIGAITLIFPGPQIKSIADLIKVSSLITFRKCYDSLKMIFKGKILPDFFLQMK